MNGEIESYLIQLREELIATLSSLETKGNFKREKWTHPTGGGGEIALLRGEVIEKGAVNFSALHGTSLPVEGGKGAGEPFFATGVSLITHMRNPHAPAAHFNLRFIQTAHHRWLGGGYDLTPMGFHYREDLEHFHQTAQTLLDRFDPQLYPFFSKRAQSYFFIPHRNKERGYGGIFFDELPWENFALWQAIGRSFIPAVMPIYQRRISSSYTEQEREKQLEQRAHYAEFNFLYDRGTKFGFSSGGNPEAILCSMPPLVKW